ncbi:YeeE/YedE family protein [Microvenator marinus]|jgi:uncharacterized membrane protein YedE/YeeE|uniref:YeeE/YedE family protein n=1 Tax=Microvenator marinus TaxID=2600177 RepID=A0A5B8XWC2_9DELT|nr:YeeE/YedE family protein [Microvenator marinus]QED29840.1 YeeE/YedE family protein [Microvenator marinus]
MAAPQVVALVSGALFSVGLVLAQMTKPERVIGFLDVANWDPTLVFVMGGAVIVYAVLFRLIMKRPKPFVAPKFAVPTNRTIDKKLVAGSALFGIGWGMAGFCPGPGLVSLASGMSALTFVIAMLSGMFLHTNFQQWLDRRASSSEGSEALPATVSSK